MAKSTGESSHPEKLDQFLHSLETMIDRGERETDGLAEIGERIDKIEELLLAALFRKTAHSGANVDPALAHLWNGPGHQVSEAPGDKDGEKRKQGSLGENTPADQAPTAGSGGDKSTSGGNEVAQEPAGRSPSVESQLTPEQAVQFETLKADLEEKIRLVEVELSVKQARLDQQEVRIQEQLAILERREYDFSQRLADKSHAHQQPGWMNWLSGLWTRNGAATPQVSNPDRDAFVALSLARPNSSRRAVSGGSAANPPTQS